MVPMEDFVGLGNMAASIICENQMTAKCKAVVQILHLKGRVRVDCGILGRVLASPQYVGNALTAVNCAE